MGEMQRQSSCRGQAKLLKIKGCQRILEGPSSHSLDLSEAPWEGTFILAKAGIPAHVQKSWMGSMGLDRPEV